MLIVSDVCDVVYNDVCNGLHEVVCDAPGFQNSWQMEFLTILSLLELDYVEAQSGITIFSIYYARPSWDILKYFSTVGLEVICGFLNYLQCIAMVKFVLCILGKVTHCGREKGTQTSGGFELIYLIRYIHKIDNDHDTNKMELRTAASLGLVRSTSLFLSSLNLKGFIRSETNTKSSSAFWPTAFEPKGKDPLRMKATVVR